MISVFSARKSLFFIAAFMLCLAPAAWAGDNSPPKDEPVFLDALVVSATKTEQRLMTSPTNISVITAGDINAMNVEKLPDIIKKLPGVYYTNASGFEPRISFRGTRVGMTEGAMVLVNGIPMSMGKYGYVDWDSIPVENVERVEVIKGPVSSLYGGEASRGVINIITKRGKDSLSGEAGLVVGSYDEYRGKAGVRGSSGNFDYNFMGKYTDQDGFRKRSSVEKSNVAADFGYYLEDDTRLGFSLQGLDQERTLAKKLTRAEETADRRQTSDLSYTENLDIILGLTLERKKASYDLLSTLYYKNRDKDFENYILANQGTPYLETTDEDVWGGSFQWTLKQPILNRANKLTLGMDYDNDEMDIDRLKAASKTPNIPYTKPYPKGSGTFERTTFGVFIQDELAVMDRLTLTAGLRYDYFEYEVDADYDFTSGGTYEYDDNPDFDKVNPRVGLNYLFNDKISFYGSYNQAYRPPTIYDFFSTGTYSAKNHYDLKPEEFEQIEAGMRWQFAKGLGLDISVYQIEIDDMLDSKYSDTGKYLGKQNIGKAEMRGVDVSLFGQPAEWLYYKLNYSYINAEYGDNTFAKGPDKNLVPIDGKRMAKLPYNTFYLDVDATLYKKNDITVLWHNEMSYNGDYELDKLNTDTYKSVTLVNTKLNLNFKKFEAFLAADNVFDEEYDGYAYIASGKDYYYPAPGTTWRAGVTLRF